MFCLGISEADTLRIKPALQTIQQIARLYMVSLSKENIGEIRKMFDIKRNLMLVQSVEDVAKGITNLTENLANKAGKLFDCRNKRPET